MEAMLLFVWALMGVPIGIELYKVVVLVERKSGLLIEKEQEK